MSYNPNPPHGGARPGDSSMAQNFNSMLQRSLQEQGQPEPVAEAPGAPPQAIGKVLKLLRPAKEHDSNALRAGYGGVYNATPPPQQLTPNALGGARGPPPQQILPVDLPPQAFLTSSMLLDMVDSTDFSILVEARR